MIRRDQIRTSRLFPGTAVRPGFPVKFVEGILGAILRISVNKCGVLIRKEKRKKFFHMPLLTYIEFQTRCNKGGVLMINNKHICIFIFFFY